MGQAGTITNYFSGLRDNEILKSTCLTCIYETQKNQVASNFGMVWIKSKTKNIFTLISVKPQFFAVLKVSEIGL
jgi:hypothetical protein